MAAIKRVQLPKALKVRTTHRSMTKRQWGQYMPIPKMAENLRAIADAMEKATVHRPDVKGKAHLSLEIGYPVEAVKRGK